MYKQNVLHNKQTLFTKNVYTYCINCQKFAFILIQILNYIESFY